MLKKLVLSCLVASTLAFTACTSMPSGNQQQKNLALLQNHTWMMTHIGATEYKTDAHAQSAPSIRFDSASMQVSGADGCNRIAGNYAIKGDHLTLGQMASSRMLCPNNSELSAKYTDALSKVTAYQVYDRTLRLLDEHGNVVLKYTSMIQPR